MADTPITVRRKCPVCGGGRGELLHALDFPEAGFDVLPKHYDIVCCGACSFVYNDYEEPDSVFAKHYAESRKYSDPALFGGGGLSPEERQMWERNYRSVASHVRPDMKVLEIGCGKGGFLTTLRRHGFRDLAGLEQSAECLSILRADGIETFDAWPQDRTFDLVVAFSVFEHLPDPRRMMREIAGHLNENGLFVVTVPDADSYRKYDAVPFYYFDREHINHFTVHSLKQLCSLHSFSPLSVRVVRNKTIGPMKFHYDIAGVFQLKKGDLTKPVKDYVASCGRKKFVVPPEIFSSDHVFLWGIGALAESLLCAGHFEAVKNLHLLDADLSKQGKTVCGLVIEAPEVLSEFNGENSSVIVTSVLYESKIIELLKSMGFAGKYFTVRQEPGTASRKRTV